MHEVLDRTRRLHDSREELFEALCTEQFSAGHGFVAEKIMLHIEQIEQRIARMDQYLLEGLKAWQPHLNLLQTMPGIDIQGAAMLLVEIGADMTVFGSVERLASWVGICPGNSESAASARAGVSVAATPGVCRRLCEFAQAAARTRRAVSGGRRNGLCVGALCTASHRPRPQVQASSSCTDIGVLGHYVASRQWAHNAEESHMFRLKTLFFGERSVTKVAGLFSSRAEADVAASGLVGGSGLSAAQVNVLGPTDGAVSREAVLGRALEPEQRGIWLTVIRAHLALGTLGLLAGALLYAALMSVDNPGLRSTPGMGFVALAGFGATFGLILGGALSLRPDHALLIARVRRGLRSGNWAVVAHPVDPVQTHAAVSRLTGSSLKVMRSF